MAQNNNNKKSQWRDDCCRCGWHLVVFNKIFLNTVTFDEQYMVKVDPKVDIFNRYVKVQRDELAARGETTHDLPMNLFKGYKAASDKAFRSYISKKRDSYEEDGNMTVDQLMTLPMNKFHALLESNK